MLQGNPLGDLVGVEQSHPVPAREDSPGTERSRPTTAAEHKASRSRYCLWNIVILNRRGRRVPFLVLLLFVLLLVCLCVMFLLIKDGIFFFFFSKRRQGSKLRLLHKYWQNSLYGRRKTKVIVISI